MKNIRDYIGNKYGDFVVVGLDEEYIGKTYNSNHWLFKCQCGNVVSECPSRVLSGHKKSCGCRKMLRITKHGCCNSTFYHTWWSMMQRCYNQKHHNYLRYGKRGIRVCEEWHDPNRFISWAESTYPTSKDKHTLDRIDNDKNYTPDNCRWATAKRQSNNRRNTITYTIDGETKSLSEWCEIYEMPHSVVYSRVHTMNWDVIRALNTPIKRFEERGMLVEINGEQKSIKEWSEIYSINRSTVYKRISKGMSPEDAITTPVNI